MKTEQHTFQFLTKRAERMRNLVNAAQEHWGREFDSHMWFGVSVEDNKRALERVPRLQETKCAVRFLSVEPQLEEVLLVEDSPEVGEISFLRGFDGCEPPIPGIDWVICGGESGPGARPFDVSWAESLLAQCMVANVPFFMKQMGSVPMQSDADWRSNPNGIRLLNALNSKRVPVDCVPLKMRDSKGGNPEDWP